jgi:hypothetical protein
MSLYLSEASFIDGQNIFTFLQRKQMHEPYKQIIRSANISKEANFLVEGNIKFLQGKQSVTTPQNNFIQDEANSNELDAS